MRRKTDAKQREQADHLLSSSSTSLRTVSAMARAASRSISTHTSNTPFNLPVSRASKLISIRGVPVHPDTEVLPVIADNSRRRPPQVGISGIASRNPRGKNMVFGRFFRVAGGRLVARAVTLFSIDI